MSFGFGMGFSRGTASAAGGPSLNLQFAGATTLDPRITFTRASSASYYNSGGYLQIAAINLLTFSEQFDDASWIKFGGATVTSNTSTAPDGTLTADTLTISQTKFVQSPPISASAGTYCYSAYYKSNGSVGVYHQMNCGGVGATVAAIDINFAAGTVSTRFGTPISSGIQSVGNGWYRVWIVGTQVSGAIVGYFVSSTVPDDSVIVWGAQLETGAFPTTYTQTTSTATGAPRFDYNPTTLAPLGLLIEEQRTNLLTYSEQFDNADWIKYGTTSVAANTTTSPDGGVNADRVTLAASSGIYQAKATATTTTYTLSIWMRADSVQSVNFIANTNLSEVTTLAVSVTTSWQRVTLQKTTTTGASITVQVSTGGSGATVYLWGAQLEAGAFPTSYIPTTTAAATRAADNAVISTLTPWYNQTQGTLAINGSGVSDLSSRYVASFNDATLTEFFGIRTLNNISSAGIDGGVSQWGLLKAYTSNATFKSALAFAVNDIAFTAGGAAPATDAAATLPTVTQMQIGTAPGLPIWNGTISSITYYPRRLSDAELQSITA